MKMSFNPNYGNVGGNYPRPGGYRAGAPQTQAMQQTMEKPTETYEYKQAVKKKKRSNIFCLVSVVFLITGTSLLISTLMNLGNDPYDPYGYTNLYIGLSLMSLSLIICLCGGCTRGKHVRFIRQAKFKEKTMVKLMETQKNQQMNYENQALGQLQGQMNQIRNYLGKEQVEFVGNLLNQIKQLNIIYNTDAKKQMEDYLNNAYNTIYTQYINEKKRTAAEKLKNLFKISKRINLNDIVATMDISRDQFMNMLLENPDMLGNFVLEGDFLTLKADVSIEDGLDSFMASLDAQFDDWENKEVTKEGKIEEFKGDFDF